MNAAITPKGACAASMAELAENMPIPISKDAVGPIRSATHGPKMEPASPPQATKVSNVA